MNHSISCIACATFMTTLALGCDESLVVDGGGAESTWTGNSASCPTAAPDTLDACGVEGDICAYWDEGETSQHYRECACRESSSATLAFDCYIATTLYSCPATPPVSGESCWGHVGTTCQSPVLSTCTCDAGDDPKWSCVAEHPGADLPAPPATVDPGNSIDALSAAERSAWCAWYDTAHMPPGHPPLPETPLTTDGWTGTDGSCLNGGGDFFSAGSLVHIPPSYCESNLGISTCEAPVSELTDCVLTILSSASGGHWPYHHGCARYLDKPGCLGTIVSPPIEEGASDGFGAGCDLKIE
ncbi:MAG: hypothetical protein WKG00_13465 [Polyangiaceae bacterium]